MPAQALQGPWLYLTPLIALAVLILRNARERRLRIETLWISPLALIVVTGLVFKAQPPPSPVLLGVDVAALLIGAAAGFWRGRLTRISVDPATHRLTSKASPAGMLLILGLFAVRYGLRALGPDALHIPALAVTDALMLLAVGLVCAQRLEIAFRAARLLEAARKPQL